MSHPGKFVSVNLNRSYGQPAHSSHGGRPSRPAASSSGGGGGMVVLSRQRGSSLAKPQPPKLSVPPPLNLPSLRKEHERFDGAASAASGAASAPARSGAPAAGWTKPAPAAEKPPGSAALPGSAVRQPSYGFTEKAVVLRGEDFPSLKAAVAPPPPTPAQRQKEADGGRVATPEAPSMPLGMRPQVTPSRAAETVTSGGAIGTGTRPSVEKAQKHDLGPLPTVRLRYDSDWADDERDTGLSLPERDSRERGFGRSVIPGRDMYASTREPFKKETFRGDGVATNKESGQDGLWRSPVLSQHDKEQTEGRPYSGGRGSTGQSYRESITAGSSKDLWGNSREPHIAHGQNGAEQYGIAWVGESANERYVYNSNNWPKVNSFQNNIGPKVQPFASNKGPLINEPVSKISREKRITGSPAKPLIEDGGFDSISAISLSAIKKKKEAIKPTDFHDPARESFEAELDRILRVQEQERQRVMEEQARAREFARKQEEERERLIREEEERQRLVEEQARQVAWQAEQEKLEAAKRAEEQRIAREEEKKRIALEEERRREAARQKLLELEAKIAKRQAESNVHRTRDGDLSSAVNDEVAPGTLKDIEVSHSADFGNKKDINRIGECINTSSPLESSSLNRFGDAAWLPSSSRGSPSAQQGDRMLQTSEANDFSAFTRPRYSMRQPRVPPPPSLTSVHRSAIGASAQCPNSSFVDGGMGESSCRDDDATMRGQYGSVYQEASHQHEIPAEHIAVNEHQIGDRESPVLGSQSSLSVSSPPSSPLHVSHDEMDVSGDSPALPTSADGERTVLSDNDHAALTLDADNTSRIAPSRSVSHLNDDEWSSENDDRRKQDEYDEDDDSYQENEINEADDDNLDLDDFLEEQQTSLESEPVILGFDEGVQVKIPSNSELELSSMKSTERAVGGRLSSGVAGQENGSGSIVHSDPIVEAEKTLQDLTLRDNSNEEPSGRLLAHASSSQLPQPSSASPIMSSASAVVGQNEVPVNLQFGLFTGPPLIPTPIPAIQIGSIQMPIHLHNQNNPPLAQVHPSTPLYQFGQLRYVRPMAQSTRQLPSQSAIPAHSVGPVQYTHQLNQNVSYGLPDPVSQNTHQNIPKQADSSTVTDKSAAPTAKLPLAMNNSDSQYNAPPHNQMDRHSNGRMSSGIPHAEMQRNHDLSMKRSYKPTSNDIEPSQSVLEGKALSGPKAQGVSGGRGKKYGYAVRDINMRSTGSVAEPSHKDTRGFQRRARRSVRRTEFRVRESAEKNQIQACESFTHDEQDDRPFSHGTARDVSGRNTNRREGDINKPSRTNEGSDQTVGPSYRTQQKTPYERSHGGNKKSKIDAVTEGDVTSLQAGTVRVVKQQGIEVPVDADGFIEVRSKKQIMNVRRELREKENRSKMRMAKVMPLTQTQLEEAMRPAKFEQQTGSAFSLESNNALSPTVTTEQVFPSSASPINSLLAGEKIQFGAVTSPTVLPPVSQTVSTGLGAPGSSRPDRSGNDVFFEKEKAASKGPCPNAEDAEAEAEAAASAVAVAAISTDEGSPADATTASAPDGKSFSSKDRNVLTSGGSTTGQAGQSSTEEPLTVALPADLSVDTPPMPPWPPLPSPQASGPMLSQYPGAQPSHFSCFDMNTMLGGHIFAFGPSDESAGAQGQHPQRNNVLPSAPLGAWPQCHSGVDSFYRPPTGFAGPFLGPGGIPGVQGPPHMVVYNHFAPVGQFGQMGLGFMGTTYIPGDKQPDWKQNQGPSVVAVSQSDPNNQNMLSGQVSSSSVPTPVQHLRPTSIMPIPSPLTMFDIAPFQSSTDIQMQPCWPHMPVPPLHSVPLSVSLQQHPVEGTTAQQFVHNVPVEKASTNNRFQEPSASATPDGNKTFPNAAASQITNELGLVEQPASSSSSTQTVQPSFGQTGVISNEVSTSAKVVVKTIPSNVNPGSGTGASNNPKGGQVTNMASNSKTHQSSSSDQQYQHTVSSQDRRARVTQKNSTGNEWQRRHGYVGRNPNSGSDKNSSTGRMKQIYVAKSSATSGRAPSG
ncbi:hypothetical protein PR202_gn00334 [Eleusine coracana subsp. coracana]|uniref:Uncharacterized protein n=1 Tax=Eleusine coracana subsp. coracana TaxID=191504 RepID=A0AAV5G223_ELECO|nr:hypothetical protein PR202_gn00230 [Eleusine coracana subsp. coracana]GJN41014.1 hypothetical protein PR202_gn00334 [Eleusine coracana subsp. coracana]